MLKRKRTWDHKGIYLSKDMKQTNKTVPAFWGGSLTTCLGSFNPLLCHLTPVLLLVAISLTPRWLQAAAIGIGQFAYDDGRCSHALPSATPTLASGTAPSILVQDWTAVSRKAWFGGDLSGHISCYASFWF